MSLSYIFLPTNLNGKNYMLPEHDLEELLLMKKEKKDFDYMTSSVLAEQQKNLLASLHFKASVPLGPCDVVQLVVRTSTTFLSRSSHEK